MNLLQYDRFDGFDDAFGHWLAGFIDGEGSFIIARSRKRNGTATCYAPRFRLALREDDHAILIEIQERTQLGKISRDKRGDGGSKPQYAWNVTNRSDVHSLMLLLRKFPLRAKKNRDFEIWSEAVELWIRMRRISLGGRRGLQQHPSQDRLMRLYKQLKAIRKYEPQEQADG